MEKAKLPEFTKIEKTYSVGLCIFFFASCWLNSEKIKSFYELMQSAVLFYFALDLTNKYIFGAKRLSAEASAETNDTSPIMRTCSGLLGFVVLGFMLYGIWYF